MIIEFTGIPGSGKTHIAKQLEIFIEKKINKTSSVVTRHSIHNSLQLIPAAKRRLQKTLELIQIANPSLLKVILESWHTNDNKKFIFYRYFLNIVFDYCFFKKTYSTKKDILIMDEGILHCAALFLNEKLETNRLDSYFTCINKLKIPDLNKIYVFIDSDPLLNFKRINNREQGWPSAWVFLSPPQKLLELKKSHERFCCLKNYIY